MSKNLMKTEENTTSVSARTIEVVTSEILFYKDRMIRNVLNDVINIGRNLVEAKELVGHGQWGEYLANEVDFSQRTANNYMQLFEKFGAQQLSIFGGAESSILGGLPYSKALALLPVPDDEVENFALENNVDGMSVRELKAKVDEAYREKEDLEAKRAEIEKQLEEARKSNERYAENEQALVEKINQLEEQSGAEPAETDQAAIDEAIATERKKHEKAVADKEKAEKKVKDLEEKLKKAKADQESEIEKAKDEAKKSANEEARSAVSQEIEALKQAVQESQEKAQTAEKKASAASNASVMKFKFLADEFQKDFQGMLDVINGVKSEDGQETGNKLKTALNTLMGKMFEQIKGVGE